MVATRFLYYSATAIQGSPRSRAAAGVRVGADPCQRDRPPAERDSPSPLVRHRLGARQDSVARTAGQDRLRAHHADVARFAGRARRDPETGACHRGRLGGTSGSDRRSSVCEGHPGQVVPRGGTPGGDCVATTSAVAWRKAEVRHGAHGSAVARPMSLGWLEGSEDAAQLLSAIRGETMRLALENRRAFGLSVASIQGVPIDTTAQCHG